MAFNDFILEKGRIVLGCCCTFDNFSWWKRTTMKKAHSVDLLFFLLSSEAKVVLNVTFLSGDCNTGQWETHLQMRNKEVCFAYQLLTSGRVAFGCCCLWFCRWMPSNGSRVMGPFPRKLHWNILTVTFAWPLKTVASSWKYILHSQNKNELKSLCYSYSTSRAVQTTL